MRIATMATGGIGGYLAVKLTQAGHEVATIARGSHLEAIRSNGLRLRQPEGDSTAIPWMATDNPADIGPVEAVIFAVKAGSLEEAAAACRPLIGKDTVVVPFLNGVEAAERLSAILDPSCVANGVAFISTTVTAPGVIAQTGGFARFVFGERDDTASPRLKKLRAALVSAGVDAPETDDIDRELWSKFIFFSALSGVTAAARCTMKQVFDNRHLRDLFRGVIAETAALARARGVAIAGDAEARAWAMAESLPGQMRASTAIDLENRRPLETEWINGTVVRLSEEVGIDAPLNRAIRAILSPHTR